MENPSDREEETILSRGPHVDHKVPCPVTFTVIADIRHGVEITTISAISHTVGSLRP